MDLDRWGRRGGRSISRKYRLTVTGPGGLVTIERAEANASFSLGELPAQVGQAINLGVVTVGPKAVSREASATFIL